MPVGDRRSSSCCVGWGRRHWCGFRAPARCRSETGAPALAALAGAGVIGAGFALPRDAGRRPALQLLLRWLGPASLVQVSRSRAMPVGDRRSSSCCVGWGRRHWCGFRAPARCRSETGAPALAALAGAGVVGAGFALPRDAGRRPALQLLLRWLGPASLVRVSRCRAMPVGDRRSLQHVGNMQVLGAARRGGLQSPVTHRGSSRRVLYGHA